MKGFESLFEESFVVMHAEMIDEIKDHNCTTCYDCVSCICDCVTAPDDGDGNG